MGGSTPSLANMFSLTFFLSHLYCADLFPLARLSISGYEIRKAINATPVPVERTKSAFLQWNRYLRSYSDQLHCVLEGKLKSVPNTKLTFV